MEETKAVENTKSTNDKVRNSNEESSDKKLTARGSKTKTATETATETSGDTESENEIEHIQLSPGQIAKFFRPREEKKTYKKNKKEEIKDENEERLGFKVTSRKMSIESPKEYNVLSQDQELKVLSQDYRPRPQNDVDPHMTSTMKP